MEIIVRSVETEQQSLATQVDREGQPARANRQEG